MFHAFGSAILTTVMTPATLQRPMHLRVEVSLRIACFLACIPSGGALLAKVYGLASMQQVVLFVFLPCCVFLGTVWLRARRSDEDLADALLLGFVGGLLGTLAYDLIRIPFLIGGQRVFAPIHAYGVWVADASTSSRFTDVLGWSYHFSNGITFGIMYALFMRGRHWLWAVGWAFLLETIAVVSPFAQIFHLAGDYSKLGVAYLGHVAYALPLGFMVMRWERSRERLHNAPPWAGWLVGMGAVALLLGPLVSPIRAERDQRVQPGTFRIEGDRLNPDWLRVERGTAIRIENPSAEAATVFVRPPGVELIVPANGAIQQPLNGTGVVQVFVMTDRRSHSSFVLAEPVEALDLAFPR